MKFYRKQPIEAEKFDGSDEMAEKYNVTPPMPLDPDYTINTLEGDMVLGVDDWIATGVNGEHWPIANEIFKQTYAELPVIPKVVADYMKECRNIINLDAHSALYEAFDDLFGESQDVNYWIEHNSDVFARAWLDGYQVEEER